MFCIKVGNQNNRYDPLSIKNITSKKLDLVSARYRGFSAFFAPPGHHIPRAFAMTRKDLSCQMDLYVAL